jgi:hypothetical protein
MTATKTRKPERTAKVQKIGETCFLWLSVGKLTTAYRLSHLESQIGDRGFRLEKANQGDGEPETYDVLLDPKGFDSCDCKGFTRWHHCKHRDCLKSSAPTWTSSRPGSATD